MSKEGAERWQFWLDVGGTFTDCLARRPDGQLLRRKVLSSAVVKSDVLQVANDSVVIRSSEHVPDGFWAGYMLFLLDDAGTELWIDIVLDSVQQPDGLRLDVVETGGASNARTVELVSPEDAPLLAIRLFLGLRLDQPIPPAIVRLGTTRGTNALLTRRGAKTALVTTRGFADVLRIGYQNRPKLFELAIHKPEPLYAAVAEIDERLAADGSVLVPCDESQVRTELQRLKAAGIESLAICLLHSYANPIHERLVQRIASELGFVEISTSHTISPLMKIVPRGDTTVVDAYLNPVLRSYVERLQAALPGSDLRLMTSAGGLAGAGAFSGKDSVLSGPAGGVVGYARAGQAAGFARTIGFDMGGTSTDVSRFDGHLEHEYETEKAGVRIVAPMLAIQTVAAGGGSICRFDGVKLVVGPESAGADPGPACYGRGGPLTVTDCNLILGRIVPEHFPFPLDRAAVEARLAEVEEQMRRAGAIGTEAQSRDQWSRSTGALPRPMVAALAEGFLRIANANMAQAIRSISIAKGYDPREYALVAFGAAGPQHACAVARELGIPRVLVHPDASVLSALGIGLADVSKHGVAPVYQPLDDEVPQQTQATLDRLQARVQSEVQAEGVAPERIETRRSLDLRYRGTDAPLTIAEPAAGDYAAAFAAEHRRLYGYVHESRPLEIVAARVTAIGRADTALEASSQAPPQAARADGTRQLYHDGQWQDARLYLRERLSPGAMIQGPALIVEPLTTTVVDSGWQATILTGGELLLTASTAASLPLPLPLSPSPTHATAAPDPVLLEVFNNHFTAIATQMGITLRNTATSVNVKERLDFSCAIFTPAGDLVVNAPHIPVHLGAMSETVRRIIADNPDLQPGDVFVTNDPYRGGSHLPDVTVVTPVFREGSGFGLQGSGEEEGDIEQRRTSHGQSMGTQYSVPSTKYPDSRLRAPLATHDASFPFRNQPSTVRNTAPLFFTASRAHHAEIGGITPGSMPPFSKNLAEEGVLIRNFKLLDRGASRLDDLRELLSTGPYPSRSVETNVADVTAQMAANLQGAEDLRRLIARHSLPVVQAYMQHIQDAAERKMRQALARLPPGRRAFTDHLDDGTPIGVAITVEGDSATIDFTGSGPAVAGNLNANRAIVTAAVMYVLRLLIGEDIPLNQGVLAPVKIILPECLLNPPEQSRPEDCPAVVGGNVETSQRVVDVLLGALGLAAASQGTMNNLLFGDTTFGYYETICGGSGATATAEGADAVHTHMTNTRLTDPEVLEARYPVRLRQFSVRRQSGGAGRHRGGDGALREIEFLQPLTLSLLTQRRGPYPPYGLAGGAAGALGQSVLRRRDGAVEQLPALAQVEVLPGDVLRIETPGGGGYGSAVGQ